MVAMVTEQCQIPGAPTLKNNFLIHCLLDFIFYFICEVSEPPISFKILVPFLRFFKICQNVNEVKCTSIYVHKNVIMAPYKVCK